MPTELPPDTGLGNRTGVPLAEGVGVAVACGVGVAVKAAKLTELLLEETVAPL